MRHPVGAGAADVLRHEPVHSLPETRAGPFASSSSGGSCPSSTVERHDNDRPDFLRRDRLPGRRRSRCSWTRRCCGSLRQVRPGLFMGRSAVGTPRRRLVESVQRSGRARGAVDLDRDIRPLGPRGTRLEGCRGRDGDRGRDPDRDRQGGYEPGGAARAWAGEENGDARFVPHLGCASRRSSCGCKYVKPSQGSVVVQRGAAACVARRRHVAAAGGNRGRRGHVRGRRTPWTSLARTPAAARASRTYSAIELRRVMGMKSGRGARACCRGRPTRPSHRDYSRARLGVR